MQKSPVHEVCLPYHDSELYSTKKVRCKMILWSIAYHQIGKYAQLTPIVILLCDLYCTNMLLLLVSCKKSHGVQLIIKIIEMISRPPRARKLKDFIYFLAQNSISFLFWTIYVSFIGSSKYMFHKRVCLLISWFVFC
jgi:hypothetical protein